MKNILTFEDFVNESYSVNEGAVKQFEMGMKNLISNIRKGYGWIDPEYVYDTVINSSDFDGMEWDTISSEIYKRLIDANLLYVANDADPEVKGKKVSLSDLGIKESVNESNDEFVPATLTEDFEDLRKGDVIKINALEYTKGGDKETIESIRPDGKKMEIKKAILTVKI